MRFQWALPLVCTVGVRLAIRKTLRPALGIDSSARVSRTSPVDALVVSISGASPVTVMVSSSAPISSVMSSPTNCCTLTGMAFRSNVLIPCTAAFTVYVPGSTAGNEYSPTPLVTVSRATPFRSLIIVTVTPGITPCASLTTPRSPPWDDCAFRCVGYAASRVAASREQSAVESVRIINLPSIGRYKKVGQKVGTGEVLTLS